MDTTLSPSAGFMFIAEQVSPEDNIVKDISYKEVGKTFFVKFHTILQTFRKLNRNGRQYWGPNVADMLKAERIRTMLRTNSWYGEMDHPYQKYKEATLSAERVQTIEMERRSHKILLPVVNGDILEGDIETASGTEFGRGFALEIIQGLIPSFSCRAIAGIQMIDGKPYVIMRKLITYDWVLYPSHHEAEMVGQPKFATRTLNGIVANESGDASKISAATVLESSGIISSGMADDIREHYTEDVLIPLKDMLEMASKDYNVNTIMESFDLRKEDLIGFDAHLDHAIIRDGDNTIYAGISRDTKNTVSDFLTSIF